MPTLCEELSTKFIAWTIQKFRPESVLEIGSWFGHSSLLMLEAGEGSIKEMFSSDLFKWFTWMDKFYQEENSNDSRDMLETFKKATKDFCDVVTPLKWNIEYQATPDEIRGRTFDLVLVDFTTRGDELERGWKQIRPHLVPGHSVVIIHGILKESISFFVAHHHELELLANPEARCKALRYLGTAEERDELDKKKLEPAGESLKPKIRMKFQLSPDWSHHHLNAFCRAVDQLKQEFEDDDSAELLLLFIPAVENDFCEHSMPTRPWIGIIHNTVDNCEEFYVPDLRKLCSKKYRPWFRHCKGLFTLTEDQEEFLTQNLKLDHKIPIQTIFYPMIEREDKNREVPKFLDDWNESKVDLVLIGSFLRDFDFFYRAKVPDNVQKALLLGDEVLEREARDNSPKDVKLIPRASSEDYENILTNSIPFLSLKTGGMANTLILEAISRNIPIVAPKFRSVCQYIGSDYPLLYDPSDPDLTGLLRPDRLKSGIEYLTSMDKSHLTQAAFLDSIRQSCVLTSAAPVSGFETFDVTVSICSFRRTHHLPKILDSLWNRQKFGGTVQIIVWNNNSDRKETVETICKKYIQARLDNKHLNSLIIISFPNRACHTR